MGITIPVEFIPGLRALGLDRIDPQHAKELSEIQQRSPEWHKQRLIRLGASEVPMAVGLSRHGNGDELVRRKFGMNKETPSMRRGSEKEPDVGRAYEEVSDPCYSAALTSDSYFKVE